MEKVEQNRQEIFAWVPGTAELELTGALFYDAGDGRDRHNGSGYNWSYGNVYVFEAEVAK